MLLQNKLGRAVEVVRELAEMLVAVVIMLIDALATLAAIVVV